MSRLEIEVALGAALLLVAAPGCASHAAGPDQPGATRQANPIIGPFVGDDLYANIPSDKIKTPDDEVWDENKKPDAEMIARWATERRDVITWCLKEQVTEINQFGREEYRYKRVWPEPDPRTQTRLDQAIAIGTRVVERIPDNTRERYRLAFSLFTKGSACYWAIDALANDVAKERAENGGGASNPNGVDTDQAKKDLYLIEHANKVTGQLEGYKPLMTVYHGAALRHFTAYMNAIPYDKAVLDFLWKIHFQLGDFREAVRLMNEELDADVVKEDVRPKYEQIRKQIMDYLVDISVDKGDAAVPGSPEAFRKVDRDALK